MITYTFTLRQEGGMLTPSLDPGILANPDDGGRVILGKHGRLSNLAVLPFWKTNPPLYETRPDGLLTVLDAYPIEPRDSEHLLLTRSKEPEGPMVMIRFSLGAWADPECRGVVIPRSGEPSVLGMAMVSAGGWRWPWQWRSDSIWMLSSSDTMSVVSGSLAWEVSLSKGLPKVRRDKSI